GIQREVRFRRGEPKRLDRIRRQAVLRVAPIIAAMRNPARGGVGGSGGLDSRTLDPDMRYGGAGGWQRKSGVVIQKEHHAVARPHPTDYVLCGHGFSLNLGSESDSVL